MRPRNRALALALSLLALFVLFELGPRLRDDDISWVSENHRSLFYGQMAFINMRVSSREKKKGEMEYEISRPKPVVNLMNSLKYRGKKEKAQGRKKKEKRKEKEGEGKRRKEERRKGGIKEVGSRK